MIHARARLALVCGAAIATSVACSEEPKPAAPAAGSKPQQGLAVLTQGTDQAAASGAAGAQPAAGAQTPPSTGEGQPAAASEGEEGSEIAYAYSPIGKRDPFRSLFDQLRREEETKQLTELQLFEVDQLKLVAIISRIATPYAMVEDPNGKGHTLTRGTLIGKNWGRVAEINPDCVVIKEEYRDYTGRKVTNKLSICLPKPDELKLD